MLWWSAASSVVLFLASLVLIFWVIVRLPADYFARRIKRRNTFRERHPILMSMVTVVRNLVAVLLICIGVLLLVLPGQGLLTIFMGMLIASFPGRRRLINSLVARPSILRNLNRVRRRAGREPLQSPHLH